MREATFGLDGGGGGRHAGGGGLDLFARERRGLRRHRRARARGWSRFAPILKHGVSRSPSILERRCSTIGASGDGRAGRDRVRGEPVRAAGRPREFGVAPDAPARAVARAEELEIGEIDAGRRCSAAAAHVLGQRPASTRCATWWWWTSTASTARKSREAAAEARRASTRELVAQGAPYLLIGVGRWGSRRSVARDPGDLGPDRRRAGDRRGRAARPRVAPSQGSHFFQNLTSFNVGYFTVDPDSGEASSTGTGSPRSRRSRRQRSVRHLRLAEPLLVRMNGKTGDGVILKPEVPP